MATQKHAIDLSAGLQTDDDDDAGPTPYIYHVMRLLLLHQHTACFLDFVAVLLLLLIVVPVDVLKTSAVSFSG